MDILAASLGFTDAEIAKARGVVLETQTLEFCGSEQPNQAAPFLVESSYSREEVMEAAEVSLDFLAALAMPEIYQYAYPSVFLSAWSWLTGYAVKTRDFSKLALGLPRGFGKTIVMKLYVLWLILFSKKRFILIIGSNDQKAEEILSDVCDMLDEINIKRTFGDWRLTLTKDSSDVKKFAFRGRSISLVASGAKGSIRGKNIKNERPDVIIFDDIQTRDQADSATESDALYRWLFGTALKLKSPHGCLYVFVANMYPTPHSILRKLKALSTWTKFISGAILEDGTSIWEELQPISQLLEEFKADDEAGQAEIFYAEVLNDETANVNNKLDITKIKTTAVDLSFPPEGKYLIIDLATNKPGANDTAIGLVYVYNTVPILIKVKTGSFSPLETIQQAVTIAQEEGLQLITAEDGSYQSTFQFWFDFICDKLGILGIEMRGVRTKGIPKNIRIREAFKKLLANEIGLGPEVRNIVAEQYASWNPLKKDNIDDILDLVGYLDQPYMEYQDMCNYAYLDEAAQARINSIETDVMPYYLNCTF